MSPLASISLVAAATAGWRAAVWAVRPRLDSLGRRTSFPAVSVALLLVVAAGAAYPVVRMWRLERTLSAAATEVAGVPTTVRCQRLSGAMVDADNAAGHVRESADGTMERTSHVDWDICRRLRDYIRNDGRAPTPEQVVAVHVVTHEARHVAGARDEAAAECQAVQRDAVTARALGASAADAVALATSYWQAHYPRMNDGYRSPECAPGRALDEGLSTSPWASAAAR